MNIMGNKKICGANLKNDSLNVVTPPHVNCNLQDSRVRGQGDFREGNRLFAIYPINNQEVIYGKIKCKKILRRPNN